MSVCWGTPNRGSVAPQPALQVCPFLVPMMLTESAKYKMVTLKTSKTQVIAASPYTRVLLKPTASVVYVCRPR